ncbi:hypothetical protein ACSQ67_026191 [Phaseolus vulgaris]
MVEENKGDLGNLFRKVEKWSNKLLPQYRLVWVRCWGLPFSLWNKQVFEKVVAQAMEVVAIDEVTSSFEEIKYTKFKVRMPIACDANVHR